MSQHGAHGPISPRSADEDKQAFRTMVPDEPGVTVRPMFGSIAAFVDGQMFMCLFAGGMYLRLPADDRATLVEQGSGPLEPMPGRPMREYASLPGWHDQPDEVRRWGSRAAAYTRTLPPKKGR